MSGSQVPAACPLVSVVIPIYNEQENLPELRNQLRASLDSLDELWEVIFVNDGSRDRSVELISTFHEQDKRFRLVDLSRNFGHQAALYAGLQYSSGSAVIMMDGDLQDPPHVLPDLVKRWREGYEVVFAVRRKRKEGVVKRSLYATFYRLLRTLAQIPIPLDSGDFSLMDRRVVDVMARMPERNKFLRGLRAWVGFRQAAVEYEREARFAGDPKYTLTKLVRLALDGLISYSVIPLRLAFASGLVLATVSMMLAVYYLYQRVFTQDYVPQGFTTLAILILFLGSVQLIFVGVLGEYMGRVYDETKRRPEYLVAQTLGLATAGRADLERAPRGA